MNRRIFLQTAVTAIALVSFRTGLGNQIQEDLYIDEELDFEEIEFDEEDRFTIPIIKIDNPITYIDVEEGGFVLCVSQVFHKKEDAKKFHNQCSIAVLNGKEVLVEGPGIWKGYTVAEVVSVGSVYFSREDKAGVTARFRYVKELEEL